MTTISAREFNRDVSAAKRAAESGPVIITDRGVPSHVLISIDEYERISPRQSIADLLSMGEDVDIDFDPERLDLGLRVPDL